MRSELENILDNLSEVEYDLHCFMNVLNDYRNYCYLGDEPKGEKRIIVFIKIVKTLCDDIQKNLAMLNDLIKTIPEKGE